MVVEQPEVAVAPLPLAGFIPVHVKPPGTPNLLRVDYGEIEAVRIAPVEELDNATAARVGG